MSGWVRPSVGGDVVEIESVIKEEKEEGLTPR